MPSVDIDRYLCIANIVMLNPNVLAFKVAETLTFVRVQSNIPISLEYVKCFKNVLTTKNTL